MLHARRVSSLPDLPRPTHPRPRESGGRAPAPRAAHCPLTPPALSSFAKRFHVEFDPPPEEDAALAARLARVEDKARASPLELDIRRTVAFLPFFTVQKHARRALAASAGVVVCLVLSPY